MGGADAAERLRLRSGIRPPSTTGNCPRPRRDWPTPVRSSAATEAGPQPAHAAKLEASLTKAGVAHDVKEYPTAGHAFLNDAPVGPRALRPIMKAVTGMGPEPVAAADAWKRIEAFFAEHLS